MAGGVTPRARALGGAIILVVLFILYGVLGAAAVVPVPASLAALAGRQTIGHRLAIVAGYYVEQPFTAIGSGLPPYVFAEEPNSLAAVHIKPRHQDLRAGHVVALIDTETGDGSKWAPYSIRTIGSYALVMTAFALDALLLLILIYWLGGFIGRLLPLRTRATSATQ